MSRSPVWGITGWKNAGKTTLVERLVAEMRAEAEAERAAAEAAAKAEAAARAKAEAEAAEQRARAEACALDESCQPGDARCTADGCTKRPQPRRAQAAPAADGNPGTGPSR